MSGVIRKPSTSAPSASAQSSSATSSGEPTMASARTPWRCHALQDVADGLPLEALDLRLAHLGVQLLHRSGRVVGREVEAREPGVGRDRDLGCLRGEDLLVLPLGGFARRRDDHRDTGEALQRLRIAAGGRRLFPHGRRVAANLLDARAREEDALAVRRAEAPAAPRAPRLEQDRGSLRRRCRVAPPVRSEERAVVVDAVHLVRIREDARLVAHQRVGLPAALPELVDDLHEVVGHVVPVVVLDLRSAERQRRRVRSPAGDDVPAEPPVGDLIDGGEAAGERIGLLERGRGGDHEAEIRGLGHQRRGHGCRVEPWKLEALDAADVRTLAVDLGPAPGVGEEEEVEVCFLADPGQLRPVVEAVEVHPLVLGIAPQSHARVVCLRVVEYPYVQLLHDVAPVLRVTCVSVWRCPRRAPACGSRRGP